MADWIAFEGQIEPLEWGRSVYTILRLPSEVANTLTDLGAKRVEGEINDVPVNLGLAKSPEVDGLFLWTGKSLMQKLDVTPGEVLDIRLRPADPNVVEVAPDIEAALLRGAVLSEWDALTPGKQRGHLHQIESAKRPETRQKRILHLIDTLLKDTP